MKLVNRNFYCPKDGKGHEFSRVSNGGSKNSFALDYTSISDDFSYFEDYFGVDDDSIVSSFDFYY